MIEDLTWELVDRADQSLIATLDDRLEGGTVTITRGQPRIAEVPLALDDPALGAAGIAPGVPGVGNVLLRVSVPGWTQPLFLGRVNQITHAYDGDQELAQIAASDPLTQLDKARVFVTGLGFSSGAEGYKEFIQVEQGSIMWQLVNLMSANGTGIIGGSLPAGPDNPAIVFDDGSNGGSIGWTNADTSHLAAPDGGATYATWASRATTVTHFLKASAWQGPGTRNFEIPDTAVIAGITFEVRKWCQQHYLSSFHDVHDYDVRVIKNGSVQGSQHKRGLMNGGGPFGTPNSEQWAESATYYTYGGANDTWGLSWTAADVNASDFGLAFVGEDITAGGSGAGPNTLYVDYIKATVYWREAPGTDLLATPSLRTLTFPAGSSCAEGVKAVAALRFGPEFELTPEFGSDGRIARFNVFYPRQGVDRSADVKLQMGKNDDDNVMAFSYSPNTSGMINRYVAIGDQNGITTKGGLEYPNHPAWRADHAISQALYGVWGGAEVASGLTDFGLLRAAAEGVVAANAMPIDTFNASIDAEFGPDLTPDTLWLGDTVAAVIDFPVEGEIEVTGRINVAKFSETDSGVVYIDITCEPSDVLGLSGGALNVVMDSSEGTVPPPPDEPPVEENPCRPSTAGLIDPCSKKKHHRKGHGKKKK